MPSPDKSRLQVSPEHPRARDGRTPPPAPSAAYARMAREQDGSPSGGVTIGGYAAAARRAEAQSQSAASKGGRARAGTMPSIPVPPRDLSTTAEDEPTPTLPSTPSLSAHVHLPSALEATPTRPGLRHTTSSTANHETPSSRLRSGSLTLPQPSNSAESAFAAGPLGSAWIAASRPPGSSPNPVSGGAAEDLVSPSESQASLEDQLQFSTLDYLGLAEGEQAPASEAERKIRAQQIIASSGPASRHRASTVSNFARPNGRPSVLDGYGDGYEEILVQEVGRMGLGYEYYDEYAHLHGALRDTNRPRATTIGAFDPMHRSGSRHGLLSSIPQSPHTGPREYALGYGYSTPRTQSRMGPSMSREGSRSRGPRMSISAHTSRTGTPLGEGRETPQVPTRSLWIGNLDVSANSEGLLKTFGAYGPIESVRMLPEKTCAFVNFLEKSDAMRARDDVLNRMGGRVALLSETAPVRIGFGKIDSAPTIAAVPSSNYTAPTSGLVFPGQSSPEDEPAPTMEQLAVPPTATSMTTEVMAANGATVSAITVPPAVPEPAALQASLALNGGVGSLGLGETNMPTRALWVGSIPGTTSSATLLQIFSPFGAVESARVLMHKCCGFINFEHLDSAVAARAALNGRDILGSDVGPIKIGFARVPTKSPSILPPSAASTDMGPLEALAPEQPEKAKAITAALDNVTGASVIPTSQQVSEEGGGLENYRSGLVVDLVKRGVAQDLVDKGITAEGGEVSEAQLIMSVLSGGRQEEDDDVRAAAQPRPAAMYYTSIPAPADHFRSAQRKFDANHLKELRRQLENGLLSDAEVDEMAYLLADEAAELSADYIGNTLIQKLFERVSLETRFMLLGRVAPHLPIIGIHKNGTWAAQKIIECAVTLEERELIAMHLRPFAPPLMCDSLGNYVCAGTLRFGEPANSYVFDAMTDRMWEVAQNRFGARCMRTCLESPHTSLYQRKRIATTVILNSIPLATNPNGALLLTWLVDQSNLPGRYGLLANRFAGHMAHLCTHKLASLTVLRIISQTVEPSASIALTGAIFESPQDATLHEILQDANNGANVISKILAVSTVSPKTKDVMFEAVKRVLPTIKASVTPPYRSLLEMVGLPVPSGPVTGMGNGAGNGHIGYRGPGARGPGGGSWGGSPGPVYTGFNGQPAYPAYGQPPYYGMNGAAVPGLQAMSGYPGLGPMSNGIGLGGNLSPLLMPHNLPLGQSSRGAGASGPQRRDSSTSSGGGGRGRGGGAGGGGQLGRLYNPATTPTQMMSPGSDPFNPFASPSIDYPYHPGLMAAASSLPSPHMHGHGLGGQGGYGRGQPARQSSLSQVMGLASGGAAQGYAQIPSVGAGLGIGGVEGDEAGTTRQGY